MLSNLPHSILTEWGDFFYHQFLSLKWGFGAVKWDKTSVENFFVVKSGKKWKKYLFLHYIKSVKTVMIQLLGEFDCKLDAKGRLMVPASLKKQLPDIEREGFVVNRGFEKHLVVYPRKVWDEVTAELGKLNPYEKKNREFMRFFMRGASDLSLDSSGRVLLPKSLLEYAGVGADVVLVCQFNKIELWSKKAYEEMLDSEPEDFASLAEEVMGSKNRRVDGE